MKIMCVCTKYYLAMVIRFSDGSFQKLEPNVSNFFYLFPLVMCNSNINRKERKYVNFKPNKENTVTIFITINCYSKPRK